MVGFNGPVPQAATPTAFDFRRYLAAKRTVDDRALNRGVLEALMGAFGALPASRRSVLELGAGIGNMLPRLRGLGLPEPRSYTLLERDAASLELARSSLAGQAAGDAIRFVQGDVYAVLGAPEYREAFGLCVAHAVLDLLDLDVLLPLVWRALRPQGLLWSSVNFDGETVFLPEHPLDAEVERLYHRSMDLRRVAGRRAGDSHSGRHLLEALRRCGADVLAAGASDWVVWPRGGAYPGDEAYFLHHLVHTVDEELHGHQDLESEAFSAWVHARHLQIARGELSFIAHQLDVLARAPRARG